MKRLTPPGGAAPRDAAGADEITGTDGPGGAERADMRVSDPGTVAFYDTEARSYGKWSADFGLPDHFDAFATQLPAAARVLDFGCGGGWAARAFVARGFRVTALDPSAGMIAELAGIGGLQAIRGTARDIAPGQFEAIWAHFSLQHIPREELCDSLGRLASALVDGGAIFIGIHEGTDTLRDSLGRLYNHYTETEMRALLGQAGIRVGTVTRASDKSYDGLPIDVMHILGHKHG